MPLRSTQSPISNLRPPSVVMQLDRLGAFHQTRLSFVRVLVRRMMREQWQIERSCFDLDANGYGTCIYTLTTPYNEQYSMLIFSQYISDEERTDRVIAEKWDVAACLCEGIVSDERVAELRLEVPKQEAGRCRPDVLVLSRANKSTRNFAHFVACLANGRQPNPDAIAKVGYLLRTTAVYGNGKFGVADYTKVIKRRAFSTTFSAQMFAVYMIRQFSIELVEHLAQAVGGETAVSLHPDLKRYLGVGNATGLGMAPFLIKHPRLIHAWVAARETALARVLGAEATAVHLQSLQTLLRKAFAHFNEIETNHPHQTAQNTLVRQEIPQLQQKIAQTQPAPHLWQTLLDWVMQTYCLETQELFVSLLIELYPELVDDLETTMEADEFLTLDPAMTVSKLIALIETNYAWAININFDDVYEQHIFWYRSAKKEEPRLGERFNEPGADQEMYIGIGWAVQEVYNVLSYGQH